MPIEFCGLIATQGGSEASGGGRVFGQPAIDLDYTRHISRVHEEGDFDSVLIGYGSFSPETIGVAQYGASQTDRLRFLIAHRPGFVAPTLAARTFATLDHFTKGRVALNIITGSNDAEQRRDGDFVGHDDRYRRTDEYLQVVRKAWTATEPFTFEGEFYHVEGAFPGVKPLQEPYVPLYISGASGGGVEVGAKHADVYMMWGEPLDGVRERIAGVHSLAATYGRKPGISVSLRPILAATEEKAWARAYDILERIKSGSNTWSAMAKTFRTASPENTGSQRLLKYAAEGDVLDKRLFTPLAAATNAGGNSTALVGTPEQVAESILDYFDIGATTILIRGYDPLEDAIEYGRDLIPLVRQEVRKRELQAARELVPA